MLKSIVGKRTLLHRHVSHEDQFPMTLGEHHPKAAGKQCKWVCEQTNAALCWPHGVKWTGLTGTERIDWIDWDRRLDLPERCVINISVEIFID